MPRFRAAAAALLLVSCSAAELRRAPDHGLGPVVSATAADVEVEARTGAWRGWPADLSRTVTPIHVSVVNRGALPLRLSHDDFALDLGSGRRLAAVLPADVRGVVYDPPPAPLPSAGFSLGYPGDPDWVMRGPLWGTALEPMARVADQYTLPTPDVLNGALREGVLAPGQRASGFVYLERLPGHAGPVELSVRLVDATSGDARGRVLVPLTLP